MFRRTSLAWAAALLAMGPVAWAQVAQRTQIFLSDLHFGVGRVLPERYSNQEDFRWHEDLVAFLDHVGGGDSPATDLVLLGDTFELWQSPYQKCEGDGVTFRCTTLDCRPETNGRNRGCTEAEALRRIGHILGQHAATLQALRDFAFRGENRLVLVPGNHDAALLMPAVKAEVLRRFSDPEQKRVQIPSTGYWISDDKRVYGDHGHAPDKVNRFPDWPEPWANEGGGRVLYQPWGEQMVQEFYNQYEELLPVIDNITDEVAGVRLGVKTLGAQRMGLAVRQFLTFLAFDTSLRQKISFLRPDQSDEGELMLRDSGPGDDPWDLAKIRAGNARRFFVESMPLDELRAGAEQAESEVSWSGVSDEEIIALCEQRSVLLEYYSARPQERVPPTAVMELCPVTATTPQNLGKVVDKILRRDVANRRKHLVSASEGLSKRFDVYVYGHTHSAASPFIQKMGNLWQVNVVNTGAFQRLASVDEIQKMADAKEEPVTTLFGKLTPESFRACYSFVRIKPYAANRKPIPELLWWANRAEKFGEYVSCPLP